MSAPALTTFRDYLERANRTVGGGAQDAAQGDAKAAVDSGYRMLIGETQWTYFTRQLRINVVAPYATGTIAFDLTGGSSERLVTLSSGTFPSWAMYGTLSIAGVLYDVESYLTSTTLTLTSDKCPAADVAAGTSYTLYRSVYTLPGDFRTLYELVGTQGVQLCNMSPQEWLYKERVVPSGSNPTHCAILGDRNLVGSYAVHLWPYPSAAGTIDAIYQAYPRDLMISGFEATSFGGVGNTVAGTINASTLTGTGTTFDASMIGSTVRISSHATTPPTGRWGSLPYTQQRVITDVTSTTVAKVDNAWSASFSGKSYVISDPVDLPAEMIEAMMRAVDYQMALAKPSSQRSIDQIYAAYRQALVKAMEGNSKSQQPRSSGDVGGARDRLSYPQRSYTSS